MALIVIFHQKGYNLVIKLNEEAINDNLTSRRIFANDTIFISIHHFHLLHEMSFNEAF